MNPNFWESIQPVVDNVEKQRPSVGKLVKVVKGKKNIIFFTSYKQLL